MTTIGIVIDSWKLATFERRLLDAGFKFTKHHGWIADTLTLKVVTDNRESLESVVRSANAEAAANKAKVTP